jgi:hypothetical protein
MKILMKTQMNTLMKNTRQNQNALLKHARIMTHKNLLISALLASILGLSSMHSFAFYLQGVLKQAA